MLSTDERYKIIDEAAEAIIGELTSYADIHTVWTGLSEPKRELVRLTVRSHIQNAWHELEADGET